MGSPEKIATKLSISNGTSGARSSINIDITSIKPDTYQCLEKDDFLITYDVFVQTRDSDARRLILTNMGGGGEYITTNIDRAYDATTGILTLSAYAMNHYSWGVVYYKNIDVYLV